MGIVELGNPLSVSHHSLHPLFNYCIILFILVKLAIVALVSWTIWVVLLVLSFWSSEVLLIVTTFNN